MNTELKENAALMYLLTLEGGAMQAVIRAQGRCRCRQTWKLINHRLGFGCGDCLDIPRRFCLDFWYKGQRVRIFSDRHGQVLDTYDRARALQAQIEGEIKGRAFDPSRYVKSALQKFWTSPLLDRFLTAKLDRIAPSYQKDYRRMVGIARDHFGLMDVRDIHKAELVEYADHITKAHGLTGKTLLNVLGVFKTFLYWCRNHLELIAAVPPFPEIETEPHRFRWLSQDDQVSLFEMVPDQDKPIIGFMMLHGVRPGEARALRCRDVNVKAQTITVSATFSGTVYREKRKGRRSAAVTIPIHTEYADYIAERVRTNLPDAFLFTDRRGRHYSQNRLRRVWDEVRSRAGIGREIRLYDATRHSFASQLVNAGTSLYKVSKLLGHSTVKMTERYSHANIDSLRADVERLSLKKRATVSDLSMTRKRRKN